MFEIIVPPGPEPVSLAQARAFLRLHDTSEDPLLDELIGAARALIEAQTGLALVEQTVRAVLPFADGCARLSLSPVAMVEAVEAWQGHQWVGLAVDGFVVRGHELLARQPLADQSLRVQWRTGPVALPSALQTALLHTLAAWFEVRGAQAKGLPDVARTLIAPFVPMRI